MADNVFELRIISPDEIFYEGEATFLEFVSVEGEMGVYKNHIPLTTILEPCVMKIHQGAEVKKAVILGGFLEILQEKIPFLQKTHSGRKRLMLPVRRKQRNVRRSV